MDFEGGIKYFAIQKARLWGFNLFNTIVLQGEILGDGDTLSVSGDGVYHIQVLIVDFKGSPLQQSAGFVLGDKVIVAAFLTIWILLRIGLVLNGDLGGLPGFYLDGANDGIHHIAIRLDLFQLVLANGQLLGKLDDTLSRSVVYSPRRLFFASYRLNVAPRSISKRS